MGKRILIVDDSTMMRKIISKNPEGHLVTSIVGEASNGTDALKLYKELNPDLVTMDITMRGMDGLTAAQQILELRSSRPRFCFFPIWTRINIAAR